MELREVFMKVKVKSISRGYKVPVQTTSSWYPNCEHITEVRSESHPIYDSEFDYSDDFEDKAEVCMVCGRIINWLGEDLDDERLDWND